MSVTLHLGVEVNPPRYDDPHFNWNLSNSSSLKNVLEHSGKLALELETLESLCFPETHKQL